MFGYAPAMRVLTAAVLAASILVSPAVGQGGHGNTSTTSPQERAAKEQKAEREHAAVEKDYNDTLKRTDPLGAAPKSDPWSRVRPANDSKR